MEIEHILPSDIGKRSFEIIRKELAESGKVIPPDIEPTVVRVIHTTADFEYADTLMFSENVIDNVTQCLAGTVNMDLYATGRALRDAGVVSGRDLTTEAALAKLFCLMGSTKDNNEVKRRLVLNLRGEIS